MFFTTKSGKQIELTRNGKIYTASLDGKVLGVVAASANAAHGWHLTTNGIALTVAEKSQNEVKQFLAIWALDAAMTEKDVELKKYYDDHAKVINANYGSK